MITKEEALLYVQPEQLDDLLHPQFDQAALKSEADWHGLPHRLEQPTVMWHSTSNRLRKCARKARKSFLSDLKLLGRH